jgi:hypothetical protein
VPYTQQLPLRRSRAVAGVATAGAVCGRLRGCRRLLPSLRTNNRSNLQATSGAGMMWQLLTHPPHASNRLQVCSPEGPLEMRVAQPPGCVPLRRSGAASVTSPLACSLISSQRSLAGKDLGA